MVHTHPAAAGQNEVKMKMRWKWAWNDKLPNRDKRRGMNVDLGRLVFTHCMSTLFVQLKILSGNFLGRCVLNMDEMISSFTHPHLPLTFQSFRVKSVGLTLKSSLLSCHVVHLPEWDPNLGSPLPPGLSSDQCLSCWSCSAGFTAYQYQGHLAQWGVGRFWNMGQRLLQYSSRVLQVWGHQSELPPLPEQRLSMLTRPWRSRPGRATLGEWHGDESERVTTR